MVLCLLILSVLLDEFGRQTAFVLIVADECHHGYITPRRFTRCKENFRVFVPFRPGTLPCLLLPAVPCRPGAGRRSSSGEAPNPPFGRQHRHRHRPPPSRPQSRPPRRQRPQASGLEQSVAAAKLPALDFILIRYGINDRVRRENFFTNFPQDYRKLVQRLRADHPKAQIILETIIPYLDDQRDGDANYLIHQVAEAEKLPLLDMHARFAAEMKKQGSNALTYRVLAVKKIPEKYHALIPEGAVHFGNLVILDNLLDAQLGDVPGWFADRHPNLAGYHVIGDEIARFLTPRLRVHGKASRNRGKE